MQSGTPGEDGAIVSGSDGRSAGDQAGGHGEPGSPGGTPPSFGAFSSSSSPLLLLLLLLPAALAVPWTAGRGSVRQLVDRGPAPPPRTGPAPGSPSRPEPSAE